MKILEPISRREVWEAVQFKSCKEATERFTIFDEKFSCYNWADPIGLGQIEDYCEKYPEDKKWLIEKGFIEEEEKIFYFIGNKFISGDEICVLAAVSSNLVNLFTIEKGTRVYNNSILVENLYKIPREAICSKDLIPIKKEE